MGWGLGGTGWGGVGWGKSVMRVEIGRGSDIFHHALMLFSWRIGVKFVAGKMLWGWGRVVGEWDRMGGIYSMCIDAIQLVDWSNLWQVKCCGSGEG